MACATITGALGLWVMGRWQLGLPPLLPAYRDLPPIQPLAATCLTLWSVALFAAEQRMRLLANLACLVLVAIAGLRFYQAAIGQDFGIDKLMFPNAFTADSEHLRVPTGMKLMTAFGLLALCGAVAGRPYLPRLSVSLLLFPGCTGAIALLSIAFQATGPGRVVDNVGTALAALGGSQVAIIGALCLDPRPKWLSRLVTHDDGGRTARWLLASTIPLALGLVWLVRLGHRAGRYDADTALALTATTTIGLLAFAAIWPLRAGATAPVQAPPESALAADAAEPDRNAVAEFQRPSIVPLGVSLAPASPAAVAAQALELINLKASERGLNLILTAGSLPPSALIDATRLREVLLNLLDNAVKFTESGDVCLGCDYDVDSETLTFAVLDTGQGIEAEVASGLFRRAGHDTGGSGLAICKTLVEAMGGEIWLISTPGEGSTFSFSVPARPLEVFEGLVQTESQGG